MSAQFIFDETQPTGGPCEAAIRVEKSGIAPLLRMCGKPGEERFDVPMFFAAPILCNDHHQMRKILRGGATGEHASHPSDGQPST